VIKAGKRREMENQFSGVSLYVELGEVEKNAGLNACAESREQKEGILV